MDGFRVRVLTNDWMEVEHPASGYAWSFSIEKDASGRRTLSGPTGMAWGGTWPDATLTQAASDFATVEALKAGGIDG